MGEEHLKSEGVEEPLSEQAARDLEPGGEEEPPSEPWWPSPALAGVLRVGTWAVVLTATTSGAGAVAHLSQGPQPGFTLAHGLAWAALLPGLVVVAAYISLAREVGSPALGRSALCVFGAGLLLELYELATLRLFTPWGQFALWAVFALGLIALPIIPFASDGEDEKPAAEPLPPAEAAPSEISEGAAETGAGAKRAGAAGVLGMLGLVIVGAVKVFGKALAKVGFLKGLVNLLRLRWNWALIAGGAALVAGSSFLVWFAVMKIRLRRRLGAVAGLVGWGEILGFVFAAAVAAGLVVQLGAAAGQPGLDADDLAALEKKFLYDVTMLGLGIDMLWASLTVCLFASLRRRAGADDEMEL
jgi:hypothetical protein